MSASRRTALIAGLWFAGTFVFSIPAGLLYDPVLSDPNFILGQGADTRSRLVMSPLGSLSPPSSSSA